MEKRRRRDSTLVDAAVEANYAGWAWPRGRARGSKKSNATGKPERWERRVESKQAWARNEWQPWRVSGVVSRSPFCGDKGSAGGVVQEGCARAVLGVLSAPAQGVRSAEGMWPGKWATTVDGDGGGTAQRRESCEQGAAATETERRGRRGGRQRGEGSVWTSSCTTGRHWQRGNRALPAAGQAQGCVLARGAATRPATK